MRKQELIHLHALCAELGAHFEAHHDLPADAFERYSNTGVSPTSIHRSKGHHREAVLYLAADLADLYGVSRPARTTSSVADE